MTQEKQATEWKHLGRLLSHSKPAVRIVNLITLYRIVTFPLLVHLVLTREEDIFKWLLLASFVTDAIDGFIARRFQATSILGSKLDSIGDDLTVLAATVGLFVFHFDFIRREAVILIVLFVLFLTQVGLSFYRYGKISTFHTYLAKTAAVATAIFLLSVFFLDHVNDLLFYLSALITGIELIEEIILAAMLRDYQTNVKGLYWVMKGKKVSTR